MRSSSFCEVVFIFAKLSPSWQVQFELRLSLALIPFISAPNPRGSSKSAVNDLYYGMCVYGV